MQKTARDKKSSAEGHGPLGYAYPTLVASFWSRVSRPTEDGCWKWTGPTNGRKGYGHFSHRVHGLSQRAHKFAYTVTVGPVPDGMQLDHTCHNRMCVNPSHLRVVTNKENSNHKPTGFRWNESDRTWQVVKAYGQRILVVGRYFFLADAKEAVAEITGVPCR